jgi:hypothetical protein
VCYAREAAFDDESSSIVHDSSSLWNSQQCPFRHLPEKASLPIRVNQDELDWSLPKIEAFEAEDLLLAKAFAFAQHRL